MALTFGLYKVRDNRALYGNSIIFTSSLFVVKLSCDDNKSTVETVNMTQVS